jgi:hypothetical protein
MEWRMQFYSRRGYVEAVPAPGKICNEAVRD